MHFLFSSVINSTPNSIFTSYLKQNVNMLCNYKSTHVLIIISHVIINVRLIQIFSWYLYSSKLQMLGLKPVSAMVVQSVVRYRRAVAYVAPDTLSVYPSELYVYLYSTLWGLPITVAKSNSYYCTTTTTRFMPLLPTPPSFCFPFQYNYNTRKMAQVVHNYNSVQQLSFTPQPFSIPPHTLFVMSRSPRNL